MSASSVQPSPLTLSLNASIPGQLGVTVSQGQTAISTAQAAVPQATTQPASVPVILQSNATTIFTGLVTVAPTNPPLPTIPGQTYPSDARLAIFAPYRTADGFFDFNAFALANHYTFVYAGTEAGDCPDINTLQTRIAGLRAAGVNVCAQLRRTATFTAAQVNQVLYSSGASPSLPLIVMATPDIQNPRPILQGRLAISDPKAVVQNVVVDGLDFYDPLADPSNAAFAAKATSAQESGIDLVSGQADNHILIQDCRVRFMQGGFDIEAIGNAPLSTIILHRCTVGNNYGQRWGLYSQFVQDLLVLDCIFDNNGWALPVGTWPGYAKNIFSHNLYLQEWTSEYVSAPYLNQSPQTRVIGLLSSRAAAEGIEQRSGGVLANSLLFANPIAGFVGSTGDNPLISSVVVDGGGGLFDLSIGAAGNRGWGLFSNAAVAATFLKILHVNKPDPLNSGFALGLQCLNTGTNANVPTDGTFANCIVNGWTGPSFQVTNGTPGTLTFSECVLPGYVAPGVAQSATFFDATRCLATCAKTLGIAGVVDAASFLSYAVANQRRGNWNQTLMTEATIAWIGAGFVQTVAA